MIYQFSDKERFLKYNAGLFEEEASPNMGIPSSLKFVAPDIVHIESSQESSHQERYFDPQLARVVGRLRAIELPEEEIH